MPNTKAANQIKMYMLITKKEVGSKQQFFFILSNIERRMIIIYGLKKHCFIFF